MLGLDRALAVTFAVVSSSAALPAAAATVVGELPAPGIVWVSTGSAGRPVLAEMRNAQKAFVPDLLVVPAGSSVRFPNDDPFFHSVYSGSAPDPFDVGYYSAGPGKSFDFPRPGVVEVACHIHARMHATIVVVDGPWTNATDTHFSIANVARGTHVLHVWDALRGERTMNVTVPDGARTVLSVSMRR